MPDEFNGLEIAVLIPCYNEEVAIPAVVEGFRRSLPTGRELKRLACLDMPAPRWPAGAIS